MIASFIVYHHRSMCVATLMDTLASYSMQSHHINKGTIQIIVLLDQIKKEELQILNEENQLLEIVEGDSRGAFVGPGKLWNKGLEMALGEWIVYSWTGAIWAEGALTQMISAGSLHQAAIYGIASYEKVSPQNSYVPKYVGMGEVAKQLITIRNTIALPYTIIPKEIAVGLQGFSDEQAFARLVDWEWLKRLSSKYPLEPWLGKTAWIKAPIGETDFGYAFSDSVDKQIRVLQSEIGVDAIYKIAVITGVNEGAQVQLCLLNYFETMAQRDIFSWRRFVEEAVSMEELLAYDVVIFIRSQSAYALELVNYCSDHQIMMVYVLDDNWCCVCETYPELERQIGRESRGYFYFTQILERVDYVWIYNDLVGEDIAPYTKHLMKMPININLRDFQVKEEKEDGCIHIGFAGSSSKLQHFSEAFKALEQIMREYPQVKLYFKGMPLPANFYIFKERVTQESYSLDYKDYARKVCSWQYDIMLSPLEDTRYINSKCINKYLEITAVGAVGIYTKIPLYQRVIEQDVNGLLVSNCEAEWYEAVKKLILHKNFRKKMIKNAREDIEKNYDTAQVLPYFMEKMMLILKQGKKNKVSGKLDER